MADAQAGTLFVAVGSESRPKVQCVEQAFSQALGREMEVKGFNVCSKVPDQPIGDDETRRGAINRASAAMDQCWKETGGRADYAVGMEGGVHFVSLLGEEEEQQQQPQHMFCFAWMAVLNAEGEWAFARTGSFCVHPRVARLVTEEGLELGLACDRVYNSEQGKGSGGLVGIMTCGQVSRVDFYSHALLLALTRWTAPQRDETPTAS